MSNIDEDDDWWIHMPADMHRAYTDYLMEKYSKKLQQQEKEREILSKRLIRYLIYGVADTASA